MEKNKFDKQFEFMRDMEEHAPMHLWPKVLEEIKPKRKRKTRFLFFSLIGLGFLTMLTLIGNSVLSAQSDLEVAIHKPALTENKIVEMEQILPSVNKVDPATVSNLGILNIKNKKNNIEPIKKQVTNEVRIIKKAQASATTAPEVMQTKASFKTKGFVSEEIIAENAIDFVPLNEVSIKNSETPNAVSLADFSKEEKNDIEGLKEEEFVLAEKEKPQRDPEKKCEGSRVISVPSSFFVDAYVSPVFGNTFFSANASEGKNYVRLRDSTERSSVGVMTGVRLGYIHSSGLNIRAGIAYQQIKTTFKYSVEEDEKMIVTTVRDDSGTVIGRDTTFEFGRRDLKIANHYKTVDIPISIGYISMKNQVQLGFHAGTVLNLNFAQNGTYLNEEGQLTSFDAKKIYNKNIGLSFFGSVELQYLLGEQWGLFVEPQVRFYPKSMTISAHPLKQNVTTFNVLTGLKYIF